MFKALETSAPIPLLILDTISFCELRCIMCPQGKKDTDPDYTRGIMDFSLYRDILDELTSDFQKANAVLPFWNGEGPLHPHFGRMIRYAAERNSRNKGFNVFSLHTNFNSLNQELIKLMIDSQIFGPITVSIDAVSSTTYEGIRIGGNFDHVMNNIDCFFEYRKKKNFVYPSLILQFIVMEQNMHEAKAFHSLFREKLEQLNVPYKVGYDDTLHMDCDTIFFRRENTELVSEQPLAEERHLKIIKNLGIFNGNGRAIESNETSSKNNSSSLTARKPCPGLWQHFGIRFDGEASACCIDFKARMNLGNVKKEGFWKIWTGEKLKQYRIWHITGEFHRIPVCAHCPNQPFHYFSDKDVKAYLDSIKRPDLFKLYLNRIYGT